MATTGIRWAAWGPLAIVVGVGGYSVGRRQGHQIKMQMLQAEAAGNLSQRIEVLSLLRMGEEPAAILRLESEADQLTRTIALNPGADQHVLAYVKTYLSVAPPSPSRAKELAAALEGVPVLEPGQCSTALKALLLSAKNGPAERDK